eukprot:1540661-Pyramimonas_sp.AAC.1
MECRRWGCVACLFVDRLCSGSTLGCSPFPPTSPNSAARIERPWARITFGARILTIYQTTPTQPEDPTFGLGG